MIPLPLIRDLISVEPDQPLIAAPAKQKRGILLLQYKLAIHQTVNIGKHFVRHLSPDLHSCAGYTVTQKILLVCIPCIAPDVLFRIRFPDLSEQLHQHTLVLRFKWLSAQQCQPLDVHRAQQPQKLRLRLLRIRLSILEIPGHRIEALPAVMPAA